MHLIFAVPWQALKDWPVFVRANKLCKAQWGDNPLVYGEPILCKAKLSYNKAAVNPPTGRVLYCLDYQYDKC